MAIIAHLCETCMTPYSNQAEAEKCEAIHHAHAYVNIVGFSYVPRAHPDSGYPYPSALRAEFDNPRNPGHGHGVIYKFSEVITTNQNIAIGRGRAYMTNGMTPPTPLR